jgi:GT2 family glycosyltransferase
VIVADDASRDGSVEMVREKFPQAVLCVQPHNTGYATNNNRGFAIARGRYVYMLNCDSIVLPGALDELVRFMDEHPKAGGAGTLIYNEDRTVHASVKSLPSMRSAFVGKRSWIYRFFPESPLVRGELLVAGDVDRDTPPFRAGYVSSASLIMPIEVVREVGDLDPRLWWFIDADYCKRIHDIGREIWCVPRAEIVHLDHLGGTVRGRWRRFWAIYKFHQGAWIYWREHSGKPLWHPYTIFAGAALAVRAALSFAVQIGKEIVGKEDRY